MAIVCGTTAGRVARAAEGDNMQTSEVIREYEHDQRRRGLQPSTIRRRSYSLWAFQSWHGDLLAATEAEVNAYLDSLAGIGSPELGARARYCYLSNLGCFYRFAMRIGAVDADPSALIERPKLPPGIPRPIATADLRAALGQAPEKMAAMLSLGAFGGARCIGMANLEREHVWDHAEPGQVLLREKGDAQRLVPLHARLLSALRRHGLPRRGHVFTRRDGRQMTPGSVSQAINCYLRDLGIDATAHQLRHWYAVNVYQQSGGDLLLTQHLLGHRSVANTQVYAMFHQPKAAEVVHSLSVED